jgi:hypothetical protein
LIDFIFNGPAVIPSIDGIKPRAFSNLMLITHKVQALLLAFVPAETNTFTIGIRVV